MISLKRALSCLLVVMVCFAVVGCPGGEGRRVMVTGKIVKDGTPLALEGSDFQEGAAYVEVTFYELDDAGAIATDGRAYSAKAKTDGTFAVTGDEGQGIPVGKYRVALRQSRSSASYSPKVQAQGGLWEGNFDASNSPFTFDIQNEKEVVLDVGSQAPAPE